MTRADHILVIDDDAEIRSLLEVYLTRQGYRVTTAADARAARAALERVAPDLIVLDLMLPGEDGLSLCRDLRRRGSVPVIMLTALGEETDRIIGLEMGADDYLPKPFNPRELLARIRSVLRRARSLPGKLQCADARCIRFAGWLLNPAGRELVSPEGVVVALSGAEYRLLCLFLEHPHRILDRDQLLELARGRENVTPFDRSIDVLISRLRHRLHDDAREAVLIKTVRGEGYVFTAPVTIER
ncbi:MAG TPA: response regulator [Nitrococcus sp.]|nr:response regulator [Nitrococcus sp.]